MRMVFGLFLAFVVLAGGTTAVAQEAGGGDQTFNPFAKSAEPESSTPNPTKSARVSARINDDTVEPAEEKGFKWPSLPRPKLPALPMPTFPKVSLPSWTSENEMAPHQTRRADEPTTWEKFSAGTKDLYSKTKSTLMPWSDAEEPSTVRRPSPPPKRTASRSTARTKSKSGASDKKSIFSWFSKREEEEKSPQSVTDFLRQPRVESASQ